MSLSYNYPPQMAYPSAPPVYRAFRAPPRLHWAWVLLLSIVTFGLFWTVWLLVQAYWVKKAVYNSRPFWWCLAYLLFYVGCLIATIVVTVYFTMTGQPHSLAEIMSIVVALRRGIGLLLYLAATFMLKSALESEPIKIPVQGLATFVFGPVYFQAFLCTYSVEGKVSEQLSGFAEPAVVEHATVINVVPPES